MESSVIHLSLKMGLRGNFISNFAVYICTYLGWEFESSECFRCHLCNFLNSCIIHRYWDLRLSDLLIGNMIGNNEQGFSCMQNIFAYSVRIIRETELIISRYWFTRQIKKRSQCVERAAKVIMKDAASRWRPNTTAAAQGGHWC